jgi:hypothetical protein
VSQPSFASERPSRWKDLLRQFIGGQRALLPVYVAQVADLRGLGSREPAPYQCFSVSAGNPAAGNHWCYTFTPAIASKPITLRICWGEADLETATAIIGVRIGTATAKAATNVIFPLGDANAALGGAWSIDEVTNANLPLTLFNLFVCENAGILGGFAYPEYVLELEIGQGQVAEIISRTQDDAFSLRLGYYSQPIV